MVQGNIVSIHITSAASQPMQSLAEVKSIAGKGLEGDRYFLESGTYSAKPEPSRQVTLIEIESIEALQREEGVIIQPGEARRNLVTLGVPLNHLVGKQFRVGEAILRGIRLCEPCSHLASLTEARVLPGLVHRGGLRAEILRGGMIQVGDELAEI